MTTPYDDIIDLPRPRSRHRPMSLSNRAAQFAPFAALTGYDDSIDEAARLTEEMPLLSDDMLSEIEAVITHACDTGVTLTLHVFVPDKAKAGGAFKTVTGKIAKIDEYSREIVMLDKQRVPLGYVIKAIETIEKE